MHVIQSVPHGFIDENQKVVGMDVEVLQQIEMYSGLCMTKQLMPIARIWKSFKQGQHDGGLVFRSEARSPLVEYVAFIRNAEMIVIPRKDLVIHSYEQLHNLSIAKTRGTPLSRNFNLAKKQNLVQVTNYGQLVDMLRLGRIDAIAGSAEPLFYHISKLTREKKNIDFGQKFVIGHREKWLQFSKSSANLDLIPRLQKAADLMIKNGDYDRIMMKYYRKTFEHVAPDE